MPFDRHTIVTPEGITLELSLAGIGSRGLAALIDVIIRTVVIVGVNLALGALVFNDTSAALTFGALAVIDFAIIFGYDVGFEVLGRGRTPGKMAVALRVVRVGGGPVGVTASAIRNLIRVIDFLPFAYVVGMVVMLVTTDAQRLGDVAAGTLVVQETRVRRRRRRRDPAPALPDAQPAPPGWDVSGVTREQLAAARSFLARRDSLDAASRSRLANDLARRIDAVVVRPGGAMPPEGLIEIVVADRATRG